MKIPGLSFSIKRAVGITKVKQKVARKTGIPTTKQGLERKIGAEILKRVSKCVIVVPALCALASCGSNNENVKAFNAEMRRAGDCLDEIKASMNSFGNNPSADAMRNLIESVDSFSLDEYGFDFELTEEQKAGIREKKAEAEKLRSEISDMSEEFVASFYKTVEKQEVLVEGQQVYPMYLKKGMNLKLNCRSDSPVTVNFYNSDSRKLLKSLKKAEICEEIAIANTAIYLVEVNATSPQYCDIDISHSITSFDDCLKTTEVESEQVETSAGSFRAKKVPGIQLKPVFEEPHKITLRSKSKYFFDGGSPYRSIAAVKIPAGSSDILYHLRISTTDSDSSSDGEFCKEVSESYRKIKFLGLPLYESAKSSSNIFREVLNDISVSREEKAYCNFFVFNSQSQAKKFLSNASADALVYDMDHSCTGTQSRNERIPVKGMSTIYLGFENTRELHDVFIWLEVIATVPSDVYYTEKYTLE